MVIAVAFDFVKVERAAKQLLIAIGENPNREGLLDTPKRYAKWWKEFIQYDTGNLNTVFDNVASDQMVIVKGMQVWSLCEHHLLPFNSTITIGYIPNNKILGLSKFGRIAQKFAHRLQVQERMISQISEEVSRICATDDVAVLGVGEHLCMTMRGVRLPANMGSSILKGRFKTDAIIHAEWLTLSSNLKRY